MAADFSTTGLRVLREVAQTGSLSAAARALGYTQSAVSRQVATLEAIAGRPLLQRGRRGVALTPAGTRLLRTAARVIDELDDARRALADGSADDRPVRLGAFAVALAGLVPPALAALPGDLTVTVREASSPALVRAVRAGTLDLAIIARTPPFRPPDDESPSLVLTTLFERELMIAVPADHPLAQGRAVEVGQLVDEVWAASRSDDGESLLGVWPGLPARADVRYVVRDWMAKLQLVAAGLAITTLPPTLLPALPTGVCAVPVRGEPQESRRVEIAHLPGALDAGASRVADSLIDAVSRAPRTAPATGTRARRARRPAPPARR